MEMHQIRYFLAVAKTLNFTRAAEQCNVSQPSLSQAVGKLEAELGGPLFRRERGRTHLTDLGHTMAPLLRQSHEAALSAKELAGNYRDTSYAPLRIGLSKTIPIKLIAPMLSELTCAFPGLDLRLVRDRANIILDALKAGDLEIGVVAKATIDWERFDDWPLFDEAIVLVGDLNDSGTENESLQGRPIIARPYCETTEAFHAAVARGDIALSVHHEADSDEDTIALVKAGFGRAALPASTVRTMLGQSGSKNGWTYSELDLNRTVTAYGVSGRQRSAPAATFINLLRAADWTAD